MVTVNAHFDGKVIVLDEPLTLKPHQKLLITIKPGDADTPQQTNFAEWIGLAADRNQPPYDPADEGALWESGPLVQPSDRDA